MPPDAAHDQQQVLRLRAGAIDHGLPETLAATILSGDRTYQLALTGITDAIKAQVDVIHEIKELDKEIETLPPGSSLLSFYKRARDTLMESTTILNDVIIVPPSRRLLTIQAEMLKIDKAPSSSHIEQIAVENDEATLSDPPKMAPKATATKTNKIKSTTEDGKKKGAAKKHAPSKKTKISAGENATAPVEIGDNTGEDPSDAHDVVGDEGSAEQAIGEGNGRKRSNSATSVESGSQPRRSIRHKTAQDTAQQVSHFKKRKTLVESDSSSSNLDDFDPEAGDADFLREIKKFRSEVGEKGKGRQ
ncbi:hypothetical protein I317_01144 [Kwoniella heveanensis CBS 569]|uniref:Uncharacterized protein n=1 Tax=Kwoniella heveanensis BCC8398 TaxID=1296120 RepID=A0A1B9GUI4_9TREE|nr:hypothetical protein I316_03704 [Kwoniella heveanensis BCC8398]OCF45092.1 hypothetical protein I317_01144 [Kwoniella heveanensis CBS 569]